MLASIELRLGYALFERSKGRLHPTKEARKLFQEVKSIQAGGMLVGYGRDTPLGDTLFRGRAGLGLESDPAIEVRSSQTACSFVRQGVGVALVNSYGLADALVHGIVVRRIEPAIALSVHVSHSRTEPPAAVAKAFLNQFAHVVKKEMPAMTRAIIDG